MTTELKKKILDKVNEGGDYQKPYKWETIPQVIIDFWIKYFTS